MGPRIARHVAQHDGERGQARLVRVAKGLAFWLLTVAVAIVMGAHHTEAEEIGAASTGFGQWDIAKTLITILFGLAVWFSAQKLNRIDKKFDMLFQWRDKLDTRMTTLETEHRMRTGKDCHPRHRESDTTGETNG